MIANAAKGWQLPDQWDALVRGEGCPGCAEVQTGAIEKGHVVAHLQVSHLRLMRNQFVQGYCILVCTEHVSEPYHLSPDDQVRFFQDLMRAAQALDRVFAPVKMNINLLGNLVPHLHAHLLPRYYDDPAPGRPIDPNYQIFTLTSEEYQERVRRIQAAL